MGLEHQYPNLKIYTLKNIYRDLMLKINKIYYHKIRPALASVLVFFTCCTTNEIGYVFKYSNEQPESAIRSQSMIYFKEKLEKETNGRIRVELFFGGILGNE